MYKINEVKIAIDRKIDDEYLIELLANKLKIAEDNFTTVKLDRLSLDARQKSNIHYKGNIIFELKNKFNINKYK